MKLISEYSTLNGLIRIFKYFVVTLSLSHFCLNVAFENLRQRIHGAELFPVAEALEAPEFYPHPLDRLDAMLCLYTLSFQMTLFLTT